MTLDIIIPVYNEEKLILPTLNRISGVTFPTSVEKVNVVVVDDCSTDSTYETVENYLAGTDGNYKLIQLEKNFGKGAAVRYGIEHSDGDLIIIQDADLELTPDDIPG